MGRQLSLYNRLYRQDISRLRPGLDEHQRHRNPRTRNTSFNRPWRYSHSQKITLPVEKSIEEQLADAELIVDWLEEVSKEKDFFDYIDKKLWKEFVDSIYDWLGELENIYYEDKSIY